LQCVAVCCSVLQCVAVCCSVLQCVAVCCSVLQCVAVCCSVLRYVAPQSGHAVIDVESVNHNTTSTALAFRALPANCQSPPLPFPLTPLGRPPVCNRALVREYGGFVRKIKLVCADRTWRVAALVVPKPAAQRVGLQAALVSRGTILLFCFMYVFMWVCIFVCKYVCMYVCMHACKCASMQVCIFACMWVRMYVCMSVMQVCMKNSRFFCRMHVCNHFV